MSQAKKVVIEERVVSTSNVVPTLFIGLGGCGNQMIRRVRKHLQRRPDYADKFKALTRFAAVDTNINDLELARPEVDEIFLISDFEKEAYAALASGKSFLDEDDHFTQWVPKDYRFRAGDTAGAGQIRIESRLGCYYTMRHSDFLAKLRKLVDALKDHDNGFRRLEPREVRVVLCFSVAGGTGSGSHLAMSYVLRDMVSEVGKPTIMGVAILPTVFDSVVGVNKDGTNANGYAALKEIEHLMRLGAPESQFFPKDGITFHYNGGDKSKTTVRTRPFDFLYLIDSPESFTVKDVPAAAADGLYLQLFSSLFKEQAGDYDNYTQHQRQLVPHDFIDKGILGFTTFYGTYGSSVMVVPTDGLVDYCARLAAIEELQDQFVRTPPPSQTYEGLVESEQYYKVRSRSRGDEVTEIEFDKRGTESAKLRDDLFIKRLRLLAQREIERQAYTDGNFLDVFRHGHFENEKPRIDGGVEEVIDGVRIKEGLGLDLLTEHSLFQAVAGAMCATDPADRQSVPLIETAMTEAKAALRSAKTAATDAAQANEQTSGMISKKVTYEGASTAIRNHAATAFETAKGAIRRVLMAGDGSTLGFDHVAYGRFLRKSSATLKMKRYAALMLLERLPFDLFTGKSTTTDLALGTEVDDAEADPTEAANRAFSTVESLLRNYAEAEFGRQLGLLQKELDKMCTSLRTVDKGIDPFIAGAQALAENKRRSGGERASAFILDGEVLTIPETEKGQTSGRRMWDFYYADVVLKKLAGRTDERRQQQIADALGIGDTDAPVSADVLNNLFQSFADQAREVIRPLVEGDAHAGDLPLGIRDGIKLEIKYRELFLSSREQFDNGPNQLNTIKDLVLKAASPLVRATTDEDLAKEKILLDREVDYMRDKFRRLIAEKSTYLCLYDESRDQQGGVRPDKFEAIIMTPALAKDEALIKALTEALGRKPKILVEEWADEQMIGFYKAVLNIPMYVFGRLNSMQEFYRTFHGNKFRAKVLHVDQNWERALPDLDPEDAFRVHQLKLLDENVMLFAALHAPRGEKKTRLIRFHEDKYQILVRIPSKEADGQTTYKEVHDALGCTIADAARALPVVLETRKQDNLQYFGYQAHLMRGLLPRDLARAFVVARAWRSAFEDLQTDTIQRSDANEARKRDFDDALRAMWRTSKGMSTRLNDELLNHGRFGDAIDAPELDLSSDQAREAIADTIEICDNFSAYAEQLLEPANDGMRLRPDESLFGGPSTWGPISAAEYQDTLNAVGGNKGGNKGGDSKRARSKAF